MLLWQQHSSPWHKVRLLFSTGTREVQKSAKDFSISFSKCCWQMIITTRLCLACERGTAIQWTKGCVSALLGNQRPLPSWLASGSYSLLRQSSSKIESKLQPNLSSTTNLSCPWQWDKSTQASRQHPMGLATVGQTLPSGTSYVQRHRPVCCLAHMNWQDFPSKLTEAFPQQF